MPVPSSGQLRLRADINQEINGNDTDDNVSLGTLSNDAGFSEPDSMSEFYSYSSQTAPDVNNAGSTNVQSTSMRITGTLVDDGGYTLSLNPYASNYVKFYFGTNSNVTSNSVYGASLTSGTSGRSGSTYHRDISGLTSGTTYYFGFYAQNGQGNDISTSSRTTPLPTNGASVSSINCGADCATAAGSGAYSGSVNLFFGGSATYNHGAASQTNIQVKGGGGSSHVNYSNNFSSTQSFNIGTKYWTYGPCYCGFAQVNWFAYASGYTSSSGKWCWICVSQPAFVCAC